MAPGNQLNKTPTYQPIAPVRELESTMPKVMECNQSHHLECMALFYSLNIRFGSGPRLVLTRNA